MTAWYDSMDRTSSMVDRGTTTLEVVLATICFLEMKVWTIYMVVTILTSQPVGIDEDRDMSIQNEEEINCNIPPDSP